MLTQAKGKTPLEPPHRVEAGLEGTPRLRGKHLKHTEISAYISLLWWPKENKNWGKYVLTLEIQAHLWMCYPYPENLKYLMYNSKKKGEHV